LYFTAEESNGGQNLSYYFVHRLTAPSLSFVVVLLFFFFLVMKRFG